MSEQELPVPQQPAAAAPVDPASDAAAFYTAAADAAEAKAGKTRRARIIVVSVLVVLVAACGVITQTDLLSRLLGDVSAAQPGDCITAYQVNVAKMKVVDCAAPEAVNKVVGIVEGRYTSHGFSQLDSVCTEFSGVRSMLWVGDSNDSEAKGDVLCLTSVK
ncbi:hypothetical protein Cs7R123_33320 [Catellatospora sp. TT07R-123]|uniref:LppU/SCO3897 family protein n=1 Tax=Catellatospora sp. TT07R-123 TaxID=2733863 RepID=UPI001B04EDBF|nr:hypothetical protein [Catellatospora sp. TT07R-123]GHJ45990.1 hypothetical protein Cs7R123_33320 [Catellatospora sp. TT07R-123]